MRDDERYHRIEVDKRRFLQLTTATLGASLLPGGAPAVGAARARTPAARTVMTHRFGVNYVPSGNWYFCYNDWNRAAIAADFARIADLGADHARVMVVWPWFHPNPAQLSEAHLDRLDQLMEAAAANGIDVFPSVFTGWLSGFPFRPNFYPNEPFYTSGKWAYAQAFYLDGLARRLTRHANFAGFDLGNEMGVVWKASSDEGDAWMERQFKQLHALLPDHVHVNGVDHGPWFHDDTFSARALMRQQRMVALHCWPYWTGAGKLGATTDKPYTQLIAGMAALARSIGDDPAKPIWAQEFGACSVEMPEGDIPRFMETAIEAGIAQGVSWFTWWSSHDVGRRFDFNPFEYGLGLIDSTNRIKPQGRAFRAIADRYRGKPVAIPSTPLPPPPTARTDDGTWRWLTRWMGYTPPPGALKGA